MEFHVNIFYLYRVFLSRASITIEFASV